MTVIVPIQVLRAAAATAVVIGHFQAVTSPTPEYLVPYAKLASAGVDLFFIISGFVMVYSSESMFGRADGPLNFFSRRAIRIIPLYWLATTVYLAAAALVPHLVDVPYSAEFLVSSYLFIPVARPDGSMNPVVGQGWTLNYEMLFYLIFAVAVLGSRRAAVAASSLALLGLIAAGRIFAPTSAVLAFWTDPILLEFVFGMLLGLAYREGLRLPKWLSVAVIAAGLVLFYVNLGIFLVPRMLANGILVPRAIAYGVPAAVVVGGATFGDFALKGGGWRMLAVVGDASYALYLFHAFPVRAMIYLFRWAGVDIDSFRFPCLAAAVGVSAALAIAIYYLFERPVTRALRSAIGQTGLLRGSANHKLSPGPGRLRPLRRQVDGQLMQDLSGQQLRTSGAAAAMAHSEWPERPRMLVIVMRRLGDVLLATPLLRTLRGGFPHATIDVLVFRGTEGMLAGNPDINGVVTLPQHPSLRATLALVRDLWRRYDLAISTQAGDRPTFLAFAAGRRRIGLVPVTGGAWKRCVLDHSVAAEPEVHRIVELLRLVDCLGIARRPELVCPTASPRPSIIPGAPGRRYAVLHANPMFRFRRWADEGWRALVGALGQRGLSVVATGGPDPAERAYLDRVWHSADPAVIRLDGKLDWPALADLLRGAAVYVGPDTSMTHLAAASGCPTVALYGPASPSLIGPWPVGGLDTPWARAGTIQHRGNVWVVQNPLPCMPCDKLGCERHLESYSRCLDELPASQVLAAVDRALGRSLT